MKSYYHEHELMRRKVWSDAWAATANANDCKDSATATVYADVALKRFDERFPPLTEKPDDA